MNIRLIVAALLCVIATYSSAWSLPVAVYVAKFDVHGTNGSDEIKTAIKTLLLSRLMSDKIVTQAKPEGAELKVFGSYMQSGVMFSLDAVAANSSGDVIARAFTQGRSPDELIPAVGLLAKSLSEAIEKGIALAGATPSADFVKPAKTVPSKEMIIHKMEGALSGLATGRTLSNGEREIFVIGNQTLRYYRLGTELRLIASIPYKVYEKVLAIDAADLDSDTVPEIYVTVMNNEMLASQVWTIEGDSLKQMAGALPYYFRSVTAVGGIKKIYAQKISVAKDFFGDVLEVRKENDKFQFANPVKLPKQGYLYNFSLLKGARGELNPIIIDRSGYLKIFNSAADELWKSSEEYGGSETYFKRTDLESLRNSGSSERQVFLDQRMIVKANGELLVPKNSGSWFLFNKHSYSRNSLYCFTWDGADLQEKWHTRQSDYYLADFAYDESSRELLMLEVVTKEEGVFDRGASRLVIKKVD